MLYLLTGAYRCTEGPERDPVLASRTTRSVSRGLNGSVADQLTLQTFAVTSRRAEALIVLGTQFLPPGEIEWIVRAHNMGTKLDHAEPAYKRMLEQGEIRQALHRTRPLLNEDVDTYLFGLAPADLAPEFRFLPWTRHDLHLGDSIAAWVREFCELAIHIYGFVSRQLAEEFFSVTFDEVEAFPHTTFDDIQGSFVPSEPARIHTTKVSEMIRTLFRELLKNPTPRRKIHRRDVEKEYEQWLETAPPTPAFSVKGRRGAPMKLHGSRQRCDRLLSLLLPEDVYRDLVISSEG